VRSLRPFIALLVFVFATNVGAASVNAPQRLTGLGPSATIGASFGPDGIRWW
jgi:hypothetical protein